MEPQRVSSIQLGAPGLPIEIRVLRKWNPRFRPRITCYIFVDKHGDAIQGIAQTTDQRLIEGKIEIHKCYRITNYVCAPPKKYINILPHPVNLHIGRAASIGVIPESDAFPHEYFNLWSHEQILLSGDSDQNLADFVGVLHYMEDKKTREDAPFVNLHVTNERNEEVIITLWAEISTSVERFDRSTIEKSPYPSIIGVTSMRTGKCGGLPQLLSSPATYVYLNPEHPTSIALLDSFNRNSASNTRLQLPATNKNLTLSTALDNGTTIAALLSKPSSELTGRTFTCNAVVKEILSKVDWFYNACPTCKQTIYRSGEQWACPADGLKDSPRWMYRMVVVISDGTEKTAVTMFNDAVASMVGISCTDLVISDSCATSLSIPPPLQAMKGKIHKFHIQAQRDTNFKAIRCTVSRVTASDADPFEFTALADGTPPDTPQTPSESTPQQSQQNLLLGPPEFRSPGTDNGVLTPKRLSFDQEGWLPQLLRIDDRRQANGERGKRRRWRWLLVVGRCQWCPIGLGHIFLPQRLLRRLTPHASQSFWCSFAIRRRHRHCHCGNP